MSGPDNITDEAAFGPRPANSGQLAPHAGDDIAPAGGPKQTLTDEQAFGPRGSDPHPTSFVRGAMDLGAAAWADFTRRDDQNNSGSSTPALDHYFQATPAGQMLKQMGQDVTAPFSAMTSLSTADDGQGLDFLKRTGDQDAWKENHTATTDYFRNSAMRPSAVSAAGEMRVALTWLPYGKAILDKYGEGIVGALGQLRADVTEQKEDMSQYDGRPLLTKAIPYLHHWALEAGGFTQTAAELWDTMMLGASLTGIPQAIGATAHGAAVGLANAMPLPGETPEQKQKRIQGAEDQLNIAAMMVGPDGAPVARSLSVARRLDMANRAGVIGKPPLFTDTGMDIKAAAQKAATENKEAGTVPPVERPAGVPEANLEASPPPSVDEGRPSVETPQRDVHGVARDMAPDLFQRYDPLAARHQWYRDWLNELRANRNQDPRLQRAQEEIDQILGKVNGVESRLTNRARTQIDDIRGGMQDYLSTDTPDMARVKEAMLENYQLMAPMQADVRAAYRAAADRMGGEAEARGEQSPIETAPAPEPEPEVVQPPHIAEEPGVQPLHTSPVPQPAVLPAETGHIRTATDIAADVSRQLQAAGRPKDEADAQAQLIASHYEARAARFGGARGTGADLYRAEAPAIHGQARAGRGQRTLAQSAVEAAQKVPGLSRILPDLTAKQAQGSLPENEFFQSGYPQHANENNEGQINPMTGEPWDPNMPAVARMRIAERFPHSHFQQMEWEPDQLFQPRRGSITFKTGAAPTIRLMANADASTFLHETGHAWLEELMGDARHPQAPVQLQHDAAVARAWLGVGEGEAIPRAAHEKWARGFERYLMEGIAPTRELATIFGRFKQWLVRIYKTATSLKSPINDDIRGVFDRLVASPDQPTIIAEPRNTARVMADMHEVEQTTTPPHLAGVTADAIDREIETQLRRVAPEEHDALLRSELEGGAQQKPGAADAGRLHEAKPLPGPTSGDAAAGPLAAGEHELAPASSELRTAAGGTGGPAAGEQGLGVAEPVEARLARRLAGRGPGSDVGGRGGLETPGTGPSVPSQLGLNVQARALAAGMPDATVGEVLKHQQLSKAEQSELAAQLLAENPVKARAIAMGAQPSPNGLMSIFVYRAVEAQARAGRDWATINELTKSKVLNSVTDAGRVLNALADQDPSSPLAAMKSVVKAREKAVTLGQKGINPELTPAEQARIGEATSRADDALADWQAHGMDPDDLPRRLAYGRAQMDVIKTVEGMKPGQPFWSWNTLWNIWGVPKSMLTSILHFSAPFVQGRGLIATSYWWKGFGEMMRYFGSEDAYLDNNAWIMTHPDFDLLKQGKVALGKLGDKVSEREEAIQSSLVEQASRAFSGATGIPDLVRSSSRAFSGYINYIRARTFYDLIATARVAGEDLGPESRNVRDIGNMINDFTGRGNIGINDKYGNIAPAANMLFFTVRKISGTMNMFNPKRYLNPNISKTARTAAVKQLMGHVATTASVVGLAQAVGLSVELDPNSSDFLLMKIGDTSFDLSGGSITYARMWARMVKWGWHHYVEGDDVKGFNRTAADDVGQYFRNSMAPTAGLIADALYGKDPAGRPFDISDEMSEKLVPITMNEVFDFAAYDGQNYAAMLPALLGFVGVRVKTPMAPKDMMGMNVWGEPTDHFSKPLSSPVDQELKQVGYNMGFPPAKIQGVKLTTLQQQAFIQVSGRMAYENIENDMSLPGWADYPKEQKLRMVRSDVSAARRDAADQIMSDDMAAAAPGESIMDKATKIKNAQYGIDQ